MTGLKLLADHVEPKLMSRATAGHAASVGISGALSFACADFLYGLLGWQGAFFVAACSAASAWLLVVSAVPSSEPRAHAVSAHFDFRPVFRNRSAMVYVIGYPHGTVVQLLLATGQRRGEIANLQWPWINTRDRTITLPEWLTKSSKQHTFPYWDVVANILEDVPRLNSTQLLFPSRVSDERPPSGWSKFKKELVSLGGVPTLTPASFSVQILPLTYRARADGRLLR